MTPCRLCPRSCGVDREKTSGYCGAAAQPRIARSMLHRWEEPCLSGTRGAGAIFFYGCNMDCLFCQNYEISHAETQAGRTVDANELCAIMLSLAAQGAHTIDLVTPTPHLETILPALRLARDAGMKLPIVYNTNGYETVETLERLHGLVDVYLPDIKYVTPFVSARYSGCADYFQYALPALQTMYDQVGTLRADQAGIAVRGLMVRHLVLPGAVGETRRVLNSIAGALPLDTHISLMGQYVPCGRADFAPLDRKLMRREYERAIEYCLALGFSNVLIQSLDAADAAFTPAFGTKKAE